MATLPRFRLVYDDVETFTGSVVSGVLAIKPLITQVIAAADDDHTTLSPGTITARLVNGSLTDSVGNPYVELLCDSPLLGLNAPLKYLVQFSRMKDANGKTAPGFRAFPFEAPSEPGDWNLAKATPATGTPGQGVTTGPAGPSIWWVAVDGGYQQTDGTNMYGSVVTGLTLAADTDFDGGTP